MEGRIYDRNSKSTLIGANVILLNTTIGAATDKNGFFRIEKIPVGNYSLQIRYMGYESLIKTDIIIRSSRTTSISSELNESTVQSDEVVVSSNYFQKNDDQPTSSINLSNEEIRRSPGSAGDVSRILMSLPSVAKVDDGTNTLAVRGGSPIENTFYIDNIEIPNINHFPSQGASGGAIGIINVDFIEDVSFFTGGFSAAYGNKLSSIMNLIFREGDRDFLTGQLDLNFTGFGGILEGPIFLNDATFMLSIRRSYLDFLIKQINVGSTAAPTYGDLQGKIVYDIDESNKLILLGVFSDDHMTSDQRTAIENKMVYYGDQDIYQTTIGFNWRKLWNSKAYSNTSLSYNISDYKEDFYETGSAELQFINRSSESFYLLRNMNYYQFSKTSSLDYGIEAKHIIGDFDNWYESYTDAIGNPIPSFTIEETVSSNILSAFASYNHNFGNRLSFTLGLRSDYFAYASVNKISPRLSASFSITEKTKLNTAAGIFYQHLPAKLLVSNSANKNLEIPVSDHYILGIEHLLLESIQLKLEVYQKNYRNFPIDTNQPGLFLIDELYGTQSFYFNTYSVNDNGKAKTQGVEITIQKKLAKEFYGLVGASYSHSQYLGDDQIWRDRIYDNKFIFSIEGGYKPNYYWEFSMRWIYAGGRPYTPFNIQKSQELNRGVIDEDRINDERFPAYHSLNLRVDKRFTFSHTNLVIYLSVWNVYNRQNVASNYWNQSENLPDVVYQWGMLPIFGVEYEF